METPSPPTNRQNNNKNGGSLDWILVFEFCYSKKNSDPFCEQSSNMSDETEQNNQIALFMEISGKWCCNLNNNFDCNCKKCRKNIIFAIELIESLPLKGADFDTAKQALTVNNFNVEQALNYHLERANGSIGAPEDDVAGKKSKYGSN